MTRGTAAVIATLLLCLALGAAGMHKARTPAHLAADRAYVRSYDVADLLHGGAIDAIPIEPDCKGWDYYDTGCVPLLVYPTYPDDPYLRRRQRLVDLTIRRVATPSWYPLGRAKAGAQVVADRLCVLQTAENHAAVQKFLADVRSGVIAWELTPKADKPDFGWH